MFVVWVSSMGEDILLRIDPEDPKPRVTVLLRCGAPASLRSMECCFERRVVKARARDILSFVGGALVNLGKLEERTDEKPKLERVKCSFSRNIRRERKSR